MGRKCFRIMALLVAILLTVGCVTVAVHAEPNKIWGVYRLAENENGIPVFKTAPAYAYTDRGLHVTPSQDMDSYTVQSEQPCNLADGFFMEFELEDITLGNMLLMHVWNQSGAMIGNLHCGAGWYCLIMVDKNGNDYMMSVRLWEANGSNAGGSEILGTMGVKTNVADGVGHYSLGLENGVLRLNGSAVPGSEDALHYLQEKCPDGNVYVGMTLMTADASDGLSAMTMMRYGRDEATATIVGTDVIPEVTTTPAGETATDPSAPEDSATGPELTDPADPNETGSATTPADSQQPTDPAPDGSDATTDAPGGSGQDQSETTGNGATPSEPADSTESSGGAGGSSNEANPAETNSDGSAMTDGQGQGTAEESETLSTADRLKDVYGEAVSFCHSSMGASGIVCVAAMGAAFVLLRKKH